MCSSTACPPCLTNAPISITAATLEIVPQPYFMPHYEDSDVDYEWNVIGRKTDVAYVGACPDRCGLSTIFR